MYPFDIDPGYSVTAGLLLILAGLLVLVFFNIVGSIGHDRDLDDSVRAFSDMHQTAGRQAALDRALLFKPRVWVHLDPQNV